MLIASSSGILVKIESTSRRLPIEHSEFCSIIFSVKTNVYFIVYSLLVKHFKIGTRNFANLYVGVLIADKIETNNQN